jgi:hypothetical protein
MVSNDGDILDFGDVVLGIYDVTSFQQEVIFWLRKCCYRNEQEEGESMHGLKCVGSGYRGAIFCYMMVLN